MTREGLSLVDVALEKSIEMTDKEFVAYLHRCYVTSVNSPDGQEMASKYWAEMEPILRGGTKL